MIPTHSRCLCGPVRSEAPAGEAGAVESRRPSTRTYLMGDTSMRKIQLNLDTLNVESFPTATREAGIDFLAPTQNGGPNCGSAVDACPSARGCTFIGCV